MGWLDTGERGWREGEINSGMRDSESACTGLMTAPGPAPPAARPKKRGRRDDEPESPRPPSVGSPQARSSEQQSLASRSKAARNTDGKCDFACARRRVPRRLPLTWAFESL